MTARSLFMTTFLLLSGPAILGPLAIDVTLPAFKVMADHFGVTLGVMQMTIGALTLGVATGQLIYGPLSDRYGRKPVLIAGLILFTACAAATIFVPDIGTLTAVRFVQGLATASSMIIIRAIVRDLFDGAEAAKMLAYLLMMLGLMPIIGPPIGGQLTIHFGWQAIFWLMTAIGSVLVISMWVFLAETLEKSDPDALNIAGILRIFGRLLRNRQFLTYIMCSVGAFGGLFAIISGFAPVLIDFLKQEPDVFGMQIALTLSGHMVAAWISGKLVGRFGINRLIFFGTILSALSGVVMLWLALGGIATPAAVIAPAFFFMIGFAFIVPPATAGALSPFPEMAGRASSLIGFLQQGTGAAAAIVTGIFADGTQMPMVWAIAGFGLFSLVVLPAIPGMMTAAGRRA